MLEVAAGVGYREAQGIERKDWKTERGAEVSAVWLVGPLEEDFWGAELKKAPETVKGNFVREQDDEKVNSVSMALADLFKDEDLSGKG